MFNLRCNNLYLRERALCYFIKQLMLVQPIFTRLIITSTFPGIPPHVDTHSAFEDPILSLSLGSSIVMEFRHQDGQAVPVLLPCRSLLIMSGEARYRHSVTPQCSYFL
jgi:hypothetical protein